MVNHDLMTTQSSKRSRFRAKLLVSIGVIIAILLIIDIIFYFQLQSHITSQIEHVKTEAHIEGKDFHFDITERGGWPLGAWAKINSPRFNRSNKSGQKETGPSFSFLGTTARIGGTWKDWLEGFIHHRAIPVTLEGKSILLIKTNIYTTMMIMENGHFYQLSGHSPNNDIALPFRLRQAHIEINKNGTTFGTATIHHIHGLIEHSNLNETQNILLMTKSSAKQAEVTTRYQNTPIMLEVSHFHLAFNFSHTAHHSVVTLQDFSFQLPSLNHDPFLKDSFQKNTEKKIHNPAIALSGKFLPETASGEITIRIDAWRDLLRSAYFHFGKTLTGNEVSPSSEALLDKLIGYDPETSDQPLIMSATIKNGQIDMGSLQHLLQKNHKGF